VYDILVIGAGLMGAAAFRQLSQAGLSAAVIGPGEPVAYAGHDGVFASHYDEGRLGWRIYKDEWWARLISADLAAYPALQERSGIDFYQPVGCLGILPTGQLAELLPAIAGLVSELGIRHGYFATAADIRTGYPYVQVPDGFSAALEGAPAGLLAPRRLIGAQLSVGQKAGGLHIADEVRELRPIPGGVEAVTRGGQSVTAKQALVAGGAFTNSFDLLPRKLALRIKSETTVLAEVSEESRTLLAGMPCLVYDLKSPQLDGIYLTPPLPYPDGKWYIKLGCDTVADEPLRTLADMQRWMAHGRDDGMGAALFAALQAFLPTIPFVTWQEKRCLVTYTPQGYPFIDQVEERIFVATGGNGRSAACSDTLGLLAARLITGEPWPEPFEQSTFRAYFAHEDVTEVATERYHSLA
jgi:sarcosine oxidase